MNRPILVLVLALASVTAEGELLPPPRTTEPIMDPSMVIVDRGAKLEVLPTKRAKRIVDASGRAVIHHVTTARASAPIGTQQLGVIFNHAVQQPGYITGEIAFKVRNGRPFSGNLSLFPGLKQITKPAVYVVSARTPSEFLAVFRRLQARSDLEWVEPTVTYGKSDYTRPATP
jgi:hypothetical protein